MKKYQFNGKTEYPVAIKLAYAQGIEKMVVPPDIRRQIGRSTRATWRNLDQDLWQEYYQVEQKVLDLLRSVSSEGANLISNRMVRQSYRAVLTFRNLIGSERFHRITRNNKADVLRTIDLAEEIFGLKAVLKFMGISPKQYREWTLDLKFNCSDSIYNLCVKRHSNQLNSKEIKIIENALNDLAYAHWPLSAIHDQLRLDGKLFICRSTFYKYAKRLKGASERNKIGKPKREGIRAKATNEVWHIDISVARTLDGKKCYLYFLVDNYSRYIIDYKVSDLSSNKYIVGNMVVDAFKKVDPKTVDLISDKGVENRNHFVRDLFQEFQQITGREIHHLIAQEDIQSSNSMIERVFRIIKGDYLYRQKIEDIACLRQIIAEVIHEYNYLRPHHAHPLQTPGQVYRGFAAPDLSLKMKAAQTKRRRFNHHCACSVCTC